MTKNNFTESLGLLANQDAAVCQSIRAELDRQEFTLEMIASENFVSPAVLQALGSALTNKYAEGYPHKRYYGGCEFVDQVEDLAIERAQQLFGVGHANVQPHSGSQANMAVYMSCLKPGDTILGMNLSEGGHLTHGSKVNFSGQLYNVVSYGVNAATGRIDFDQVRDLARTHRPKLIVCGASAYPRQIDFKIFREIANEVEALLMADIAHPAGLVAAKLHPDPVPHCDFITSTTHKTLRGPRGGLILCSADSAKKINSAIFPGIQGGPLMHVIAAKAVAFGEALKPEFRDYCARVIQNTQVLGDVFVRHGFDLVSGGTDNHLILVDLSRLDLSGKDAEAALERAGITVNKNTVPGEKRSPFITSGIRVGTAALTTRGFDTSHIQHIGEWMVQILRQPQDTALADKIRGQAREMCQQKPLYVS